MGLDDLLKSLAVFKDGVQSYAQSRAVNDANAAMTELQIQEAQAGQQLIEQRNAISTDLAMRLGSAGADSAKIGQLTSSIAPSQGAQYQAAENEELQGKSQKFNASESSLQRQHEKDMLALKGSALGIKDDRKIAKNRRDLADRFYKTNQKEIDSVDKMDTFRKIIDENPSQLGLKLAQRGIIKSSGDDRISDEDLKGADNDPSIRKAIARKAKLELTGEALKDDRQFYSALLKNMETYQLQKLEAKVKGYSTSVSELDGELDAGTMEQGIRSRIPALGRLNAKENDVKAKKEQQVAKLTAWANSPEAKKPENAAKLQKVQAALTQLKGQ